MSSNPHRSAYRAEIRFADCKRWITIGVEDTRLVAEAGLRAVVGSWDRLGRPPVEVRVVEIPRPRDDAQLSR
jgi:hypothetical protein